MAQQVGWLKDCLLRDLENGDWHNPCARIKVCESSSRWQAAQTGLIGAGGKSGGQRNNTDSDVGRIKAALEVLPRFGIATECGLGRVGRDPKDPDSVDPPAFSFPVRKVP